MLKTYSVKGNTVIIPFSIKTAVSNFSFKAEFKGGDAFGLTGKTRKATYKTKKPLEQYAIESSEMFSKGLITLEDAVDTQAEVQAKAKAAARRMKAEEDAEENEVNEELENIASTPKTTKKKK